VVMGELVVASDLHHGGTLAEGLGLPHDGNLAVVAFALMLAAGQTFSALAEVMGRFMEVILESISDACLMRGALMERAAVVVVALASLVDL